MSLVLGCGKKGLEWARRQKGEITIGFDNDPNLPGIDRFIQGDVLNTGLDDGTVKIIYADFLLNALMPPGASFQEVISNPAILGQAPWPPIVRNWYQQDFQPSGEPVTDHLKEIRRLLRRAALQEMWRILKVGGEIILVDKREVIDWVVREVPDFLPSESSGIEIAVLPISSEDHQRSDAKTLKLLNEFPQGAKKVVVRKRPC